MQNRITNAQPTFSWLLKSPPVFVGRVLVLLALFALPAIGWGQAKMYTWKGGADNSWTLPTNWIPDRDTPLATDLLTFDGSEKAVVTVVTNFASGTTVARLELKNNVTVNFTNDTNGRTLLISNGSTGADLSIEAGSKLSINCSAENVSFGLKMEPSATASIAGSLVFFRGTNQLLGSGANTIEFVAGSLFQSASDTNGSPFGTIKDYAGNVLFRNGSTLEQAGGGSPFGISGQSAAITLEPSSNYVFSASGNPPSISGRTYGNLEIKLPTGSAPTTVGTSPLTIAGNLIVTSGGINLKLESTINIKGSIDVIGSSLKFNPASAGTIALNGTTPQTISGTGSISFEANASLQIDNPAGVTISRPLTVNNLQLTKGVVKTTGINLLTLIGANTLAAGGAGYINGPFARKIEPVDATAPVSVLFPISSGAIYRPLTLNIASQTASSTYTASQAEGNPGQNVDKSSNGGGTNPLQRVSFRRSYTVSSLNPTPGFTGTITLSFGSDDFVNEPNSPDLVIAKRSSSAAPWTNLGRTISTGTGSGPGGAPVIGTLTSNTFTTFSDFTLGAQNLNDQNNLSEAINPLPVQLTSFTAQRQAGNAALLKWATASEKNSAYFEVQRSLDGREFTTVAKVAARGNSSELTAYSALDPAAPAGRLYYRLRQADLDGTVAFSPVAAVARTGPAANVLLYPNPARGSIGFQADGPTPYRVLNQLGQSLLQGTTRDANGSVALEALPPGLYLLELQTAGGRAVQRFQKE